jgi:hypothetical protein
MMEMPTHCSSIHHGGALIEGVSDLGEIGTADHLSPYCNTNGQPARRVPNLASQQHRVVADILRVPSLRSRGGAVRIGFLPQGTTCEVRVLESRLGAVWQLQKVSLK